MLRRLAMLSILAAGLSAAPALALADPHPGEALFKQRCGACHALEAAPGKLGPPLKGVAGRKAGAVPGYAYSPAMKKAAFAWTPAQLDKFLKAPGQTVPGTKMMIGLPDAKQRSAVVAYLAAQKGR